MDLEEDIKKSEKSIMQLQETLRNVIKKMKGKGKKYICLNAHIDFNTLARLTQ